MFVLFLPQTPLRALRLCEIIFVFFLSLKRRGRRELRCLFCSYPKHLCVLCALARVNIYSYVCSAMTAVLLIMRRGSLFAFSRYVGCGGGFQLLLQNGYLQLQLIDQLVLINDGLIQYIDRVLDVRQPDLNFCNSFVHIKSCYSAGILLVIFVAAQTATGIARKLSTGTLVIMKTPVPRPSERILFLRL